MKNGDSHEAYRLNVLFLLFPNTQMGIFSVKKVQRSQKLTHEKRTLRLFCVTFKHIVLFHRLTDFTGEKNTNCIFCNITLDVPYK